MERYRSNLMRLGLSLVAAIAMAACKPSHQTFQVKGAVEEVLAEQGKVRIAHEHIPGYMMAMTMVFDVRDTNDLAGIQERDIVSFRMVVATDDGWIENLQKIGVAPPPTNQLPAVETTRIVKQVEELYEGDLLPNYPLTNQFGKLIHTDDFRGQALAFTFIFTRCPFPVYCPRMSTNFNQVLRALKALPEAPANWHLLTLSFDPGHDTPEVLKAYAERYEYDPNYWTFGSSSLMEISAIGEHFGLLFWRPNPLEEGNISHNIRTVVLNTKGLVTRVFTDETWKPEELVAEILKATKVEPVSQ